MKLIQEAMVASGSCVFLIDGEQTVSVGRLVICPLNYSGEIREKFGRTEREK